MRLLILDSNAFRLAKLSSQLAGNEYHIRTMTNGALGWQLVNDQAFDLVLLTAGLADLDEYGFVQQVRQRDLPLTMLMLGTPDHPAEREASQQAGADAFLDWPFLATNLAQLVKELYWQHRLRGPYWLRQGDLSLNITNRIIYQQQQPFTLSERECHLLAILMQYLGHILSKAQFVGRIWGETDGQRLNRVEVYMTYLRKKIDDAFPKKLIQTVVGAGYMLAPLTHQPLTDQPMTPD